VKANPERMRAGLEEMDSMVDVLEWRLDKTEVMDLEANPVATEDIHNGLVELGFDVISVKQMSTARRSPEGTTSITLPLFLITLPRTEKS
jgi:hypothetical protein